MSTPSRPIRSPSRTSSGTTRIPRAAISSRGQVGGRVGHDGDGHDAALSATRRSGTVRIRPITSRCRRCSRPAASAGGRRVGPARPTGSCRYRRSPARLDVGNASRPQTSPAIIPPCATSTAVASGRRRPRRPAPRRPARIGAPRRSGTPRPAVPSPDRSARCAIAPGQVLLDLGSTVRPCQSPRWVSRSRGSSLTGRPVAAPTMSAVSIARRRSELINSSGAIWTISGATAAACAWPASVSWESRWPCIRPARL